MLSSCLQLLCSELFQKHTLLLRAFLPGLPRKPIHFRTLQPWFWQAYARQIVYAPCTFVHNANCCSLRRDAAESHIFFPFGDIYVLPLVGQSSVKCGLLARQLYSPPAPFQAAGPSLTALRPIYFAAWNEPCRLPQDQMESPACLCRP